MLYQCDNDGFRAIQMIQDKAQTAGNGISFSRAAPKVGALGDPDWIIWIAPFGRVGMQPLAALHLLTRADPLPARCALRSTAFRLAETVIITLIEH